MPDEPRAEHEDGAGRNAVSPIRSGGAAKRPIHPTGGNSRMVLDDRPRHRKLREIVRLRLTFRTRTRSSSPQISPATVMTARIPRWHLVIEGLLRTALKPSYSTEARETLICLRTSLNRFRRSAA